MASHVKGKRVLGTPYGVHFYLCLSLFILRLYLYSMLKHVLCVQACIVAKWVEG